jgi:polyphosphate glucokinase
LDYGDNLDMVAKKRALPGTTGRKARPPERKGRESGRVKRATAGVAHAPERKGRVTARKGRESGPMKRAMGGVARVRGRKGHVPGRSDAQRSDAQRSDAQRVDAQRILVLDVGGSHVKLRVGDRGSPKKFVSGPKMSAADMVKDVRKLVAPDAYDAVSIGYPGMVIRGRIAAEPFNLGKGWVGFDFEKGLGKPVRIINDAAMQAVGSYAGGRMLFLGLGTGMGATLILDGVVEPMEFGHLPYKNGRTYEQYVGQRGLDRLGKKKWRKEVAAVVEQLRNALEVDYVVLGGGNVRLLKELPKGAHQGANSNAMTGGRLIWEATGSPLVLSPKYRAHATGRGK